MEAVKRLPMVCFEIKNSPEATSFHNLKQCIAEYYGEDPESYAKEFRELEELRGLACRPRVDIDCLNTIKRYYSQLHSLQNRFPLSSETELLNFAWKDIYSGSTWHTSNIRYEMASILYNIAALHSKLGVDEERADPESMKLACTHFQCAAWAFGEIKNQYALLLRNDLAAELMIFMQNMCFAQAQECILEKSLADNRKAAIIAKVTAQVVSFYNAAMSALFSQNEDGTIQELIGNKDYKEWLKYIKFKTSYLSSILFLYQGQHSEEQRKMGERLALFNAACDKLEEAKKEAKGMNKIDVINEALVLATDIIEGKRKNAKQENEFIYHEAIPDLSTISAIQGANLVQGISFDVADPQIIGEDIFKRLVPMKAHENLSLYSEEKAQILRKLSVKIDERDAELASFMGALNMDLLNAMKQPQEKLPQNLVDRCAELNAKPSAIPDLIESMSNLGNICVEVEFSLNEIKQILDEESKQEKDFQKQMGKRPTGHMTDLRREFTKYLEAHNKAGESNTTLTKAMELHVSNLKILAQPLSALKQQVPQSEVVDENVRKELETLLSKVEEMKTQRDVIYNELRDQILNKDDITSQLIAHGEKDVEELFKKELKKYSQSVSIIEQNLVAQGNILKALTDTYAKHAMTLKGFNDVKSKREQFYSSLINSFDVYEDLLSKSAKGLDFYKKLHGNIQKLLSRVKAARDVQEEERQQLLKTVMPKVDSKQSVIYPNSIPQQQPAAVPTNTTGMKLKDYIKSGMVPNMIRDDSKIPAIRPNPVGQETIPASSIAACPSINYPQASSYNPTQYYQLNNPNNPYANQQQYYQAPQQDQQPYNSNKIAPNSVSSVYSQAAPSMYSQTVTPSVYSQTVKSQESTTGYVNPMYQTNVHYGGNQMGYGSGNYQNVQQYSQQTNYSDQKAVAVSSIPTNVPYGVSTPISAGGYIGQQYYTNQQPQSPVVNPQSAGINTLHPAAGYQSQVTNTNSLNSAISPQNQIINPQSQTVNLQNPAISSQHSIINPTNSAIIPQNSVINPQTSQMNINQVATSSQSTNPAYYQQPSSGDFIQNIYKTQLQYPTVQSPVQNYSAAPVFVQNTSAVQTSTTQNYATQSPQTSQYSQQYGQQQNTPYYNPYATADNNTAQVTQSATYYQTQTGSTAVSGTAQNYAANPAVSGVQNYQTTQTASGTQNTSNYPVSQNYTVSSGNSVNQNNTTFDGNMQSQVSNQSNIYYQNAIPQSTISNSYGSVQPQNYPQNSMMNNTQSMTDQHIQPQTGQQNPAINGQTQVSSNSQNPTSNNPQIQPQPASTKAIKSGNIDLLSDIEFSAPSSTINNIPLLTPISIVPKKDEEVVKVEAVPVEPQKVTNMNDDLADLDFSLLNMTTISPTVPVEQITVEKQPVKFEDPFEDVNVLKQFHKEVESLERYMESLTIKTLNGITPLANKWKELQDLLVKDEATRSISIAKLFPDKNRSADFLPYDHGRVMLPTSTDNYINAAMLKNCGPVPFIMAQIPMENTLNDYWEMIWSQKSNVIVCLCSSSELLDPFWPQNMNEDKLYGEVTVTLVKQFELSHCIEKQLKVTRQGCDTAVQISLLQIKNWKKRSADNILDISSNIITSFKQINPHEKQHAPIVLSCINGGTERSGLITLGVCAIFGTQMRKPILLNVVDHWYRICSQRKGILDDESYLQLSFQIVLNNAHRILNRRGIMTSYQVKNAEKLSSPTETENTVKDSLQELDPFWKFK